MFYRVFVSRNDMNADGVIDKSEFRGSGDRFDQMDENKNGKIDQLAEKQQDESLACSATPTTPALFPKCLRADSAANVD